MNTINKIFIGIGIAAVLGMLGTCAGILVLGGAFDGDHPSDAELMRRFAANQQAFAQLITMSDQDSDVIRIAPDFTRLDSNWQWPRSDSLLGITRDRWNEYRKLFGELGLKSGIWRERLPDSSVVIFLTAHSRGIVNGGSSKGYAYSKHPLTPRFASLDTAVARIRSGTKHGVAYRPIERDWYLALDW